MLREQALSQTNVRQPALQVLANGTPVAGVYEAEVRSNGYLGADSFMFRAALGSIDYAVWTALPIQIEIQFGINGTWQSFITGSADDIEVDAIQNNILVNGRDLTAVFIAAQTHESFENLTSSEVAVLFSGRHGILASVTPTSTPIGRYYQDGHTRSVLSQHGRATTEWDILSWLAQQEGYDVWISGDTLYFQPASTSVLGAAVAPANCLDMRLKRDLSISAGFTIQVQSWDSASQQGIAAQATYGSRTTGTASMVALRPNLSVGDAQILALRMASQLSGHERTLSYEIPADLTTMPRMQIQLADTNTDFDGSYTVYEVERRFSVRHGFTQQVQARRASWIVSSIS
jgi:hypothetical protein